MRSSTCSTRFPVDSCHSGARSTASGRCGRWVSSWWRRWWDGGGASRDLLLSGFLAWLIARALGEAVVAHETIRHSVRVATALSDSPSFPAVRVAVTVAVISAASPYVTLPTRVVGRALVTMLAITTLYLGAAFPNDLFAGLILGWGVAAAVHLAFGSPGGRPTTAQVARSLAELGIAARDVRLATRQPHGSTLMYATDGETALRVKVIGRDEADAQLLAKLWRFLLYRDSGHRCRSLASSRSSTRPTSCWWRVRRG